MKESDRLDRWKKRSIVILTDLIMTIPAWFGALWVTSSFSNFAEPGISGLIMILILCPIYFFCGLYRGVWRFASIPDLIRIARAVLVGMIAIVLFFGAAGSAYSLKAYLAFAFLLVVMLSSPRIIFRWLHEYRQPRRLGQNVLIVGAGSAGESLIRELRRLPPAEALFPAALVDDDPARIGGEVQGVRILGACHDIPAIVSRCQIQLILIAIPSAGSQRMREIVTYCEQSGAAFRTLPGIRDIADGVVSVNSLREVQLEDLLGREQVQLDWGKIQDSIKHRVVLVTGGGGSIGSELCRQICRLSPKKLIIADNNEFNLYAIDMAIKKDFPEICFSVHLCSVTDRPELTELFSAEKPDMVFHAAAYKHVPLLEDHLRVAMHNNIIGTRLVAELADKHQVNTFVLISTDKAVNPANVMGATKRAAEVICQNFNAVSRTRFITVRFGNVLDSAGSVIPLFRRQLAAGGPLTVTHPDISRYFMTIPEACRLILQAAAMGDGGIFVLDMGSPVKIHWLAEQMIRLSGRTVGQDIGIQYIGLRPGEKLHEELFHDREDVEATTHEKIHRAAVRYFDWDLLTSFLESIEVSCSANDVTSLQKLLCALVPEYTGQYQSATEKKKQEISDPLSEVVSGSLAPG